MGAKLNPCGWLSPQGKFFECSTFQHDAMASHIVEHVLNVDSTKGLSDTHYLESNNWAKFNAFHDVDTDHDNLTESQVVWILENIEYIRPDSWSHILSSLERLGHIDREFHNKLNGRKMTLDQYKKFVGV